MNDIFLDAILACKNLTHRLEALQAMYFGSSEYPRDQLLNPDLDAHQLLHRRMQGYAAAGILRPVKSSGHTGNLVMPLFNRYRVLPAPREDPDQYQSEILSLTARFNRSGYLEETERYTRHRHIVAVIDRAIRLGLLETTISKKERSFALFHDEKFIEKNLPLVREVLRYNRFPDSFLQYYETPEPFFMNRFRPEKHIYLLLENKDIWYSLNRAVLASGSSCLLGYQVDAALYGEGNKASRVSQLTDFFASEAPDLILYHGDLDAAGLSLFERIRDANPELRIRPFRELYQVMVTLARGMPMDCLSRCATGQGESLPAVVREVLGDQDCTWLEAIWQGRQYIPQEILHYGELLRLLRSEIQ